MIKGIKKRQTSPEFGRLFNSKHMVITLLKGILSPDEEKEADVDRVQSKSLHCREQLRNGNNFWQPISQFYNLQDFFERNMKAIKHTHLHEVVFICF